jgi:hypothetical protein
MGPTGLSIPGQDGADGEDALLIPGPQGNQGERGPMGFALDGEPGEDAIPMSPNVNSADANALTGRGDTTLHYHNSDRFYSINVLSLNVAAPADGTTVYFAGMAVGPAAASSAQRLYIPFAGVIKKVYLFGYAGTVGTNESIGLYFRLNGTSDYLIGTGDASVNEMPVSTTALNSGNGVTVAAGDYFEIKIVYPTWATNPANIRWSGVVFVEQ